MEKKAFEYAGVYLLDSPYFLDGMYDYFIPLELRGEVYPGRFLTVPFGKSNRRQMAIVRELHPCPSFSDIKPIDGVCYDRPELSEEMLLLCDYMKEQCLCTYGEAVRCTTPSSALGKMTEFYYPLPQIGPNMPSFRKTQCEIFVTLFHVLLFRRFCAIIETKIHETGGVLP